MSNSTLYDAATQHAWHCAGAWEIIYDLWCSYVEKLLDTVEIHTTDANKDIIKDALMVYGRKKITILLRSPE